MARVQKRKKMRNPHPKTVRARERVLKEAKKTGIISNQRACYIGKWDQAWFHLNALRKAGLLRRVGYNQWMPMSAGRR